MNRLEQLAYPDAGGTAPNPSVGAFPPAEWQALRPGVLIVDDTEGVRRVIGAGLSLHGFTVWLAADAKEAVETYRAHHSSIDVVLLDVQMPDRDGPRTLMDLRTVNPDLVAVFMTGSAGHYTQQNLLDLGALAVLQKPFRMGELAIQLTALTTPIGRSDDLPDALWGHDGGQVIGFPLGPD